MVGGVFGTTLLGCHRVVMNLLHETGSSRVEVALPHGKICYLEIRECCPGVCGVHSGIFGWKVRTRGDGELAFDDTGGVSGTWVKESDRTPDERTRVYIMVDVITDTLNASRRRVAAS